MRVGPDYADIIYSYLNMFFSGLGRAIMIDDRNQDEALNHMSEFFKMVGNSTRLKILFCLLEKPLCVCELTAEIQQRQPCISQHLYLLRNAGLVSLQQIGWHHYYAITTEGLRQYLHCLRDNWNELCESDHTIRIQTQ